MKRRVLGLLALSLTLPSVGAAQQDTAGVRKTIEAIAVLSQAEDVTALDSIWSDAPSVRVIEGAGVNRGWADYRDHHLMPEFKTLKLSVYRYFEVEPQVRGETAWAAFRYELVGRAASGAVAVDGRGTAVLEWQAGRWRLVHLHTSGRRRP